MYDAVADPYCYPGTTVLMNLPGLRSQEELNLFEAASTTQRADEPIPAGSLSVSYYQALHHHLFQDVYMFAGKFRTVRLSKDESAFCYPEHIEREMQTLFAGLEEKGFFAGLSPERFAAEAASFLATLNAVHPFREGNGRTQTLFLAVLADQVGRPLDLERLEPEAFLDAMIRSFGGDTAPLTENIQSII